MNTCCVYIHRKATNGQPFYVGKGSAKRAKTSNGRSAYWHRIANKYGRTVHIVADALPEICSFSFERALIAAIGKDTLCNLTKGGEGTSGRIMDENQRKQASERLRGLSLPIATVQAARAKNFKPVGTRCGLCFDSVSEAGAFANPSNPSAGKVCISLAARGGMLLAYGREWGFLQDGRPVFLYQNGQHKKPVQTQCGNRFDGACDAVRWLQVNGFPKAISSNITQCCKGRVQTAYGYRWAYV